MARTIHHEPHPVKSENRLNQLRAAVLGANDGITSVAGLIFGVAGATDAKATIVTAGIAGLIAGAISMAAGEYVSVSSQRDTEKALMTKERSELEQYPKEELEELIGLYQKKGLSRATAARVAKELTEHDVFAAHLDTELGIDPNDLTSPVSAAVASALSFTAGGLIPLIAIALAWTSLRIPITFIAVVIALIITGALSARASGSGVIKPITRVVTGGVLAMIITYAIGSLFHVRGI